MEADARDGFASVRTPIVSLSLTDDEMMSARNIESLHGFYQDAPRTMNRLDPRNPGLTRIGRFGFFRPEEIGKAPWPTHRLPVLAG